MERMRINIALLLVLVNVAIGQDRKILQFSPTPEGIKTPSSFLSSVGANPPDWYASWPTSYKVILLGKSEFSFTMICSIYALDKENSLEDIKFCFNDKEKPDNENCKVLSAAVGTGEMNTKKDGHGALVKLKVNGYNGGQASIDRVSKSVIVTSTFYCQLKNRRGSITSNNIDIEDLRHQFPSQIKSQPRTPLPLPYKMNSPIEFPCSTTPMDKIPLDVTVKYDWKYCTNNADNLRRCERQQDLMTTINTAEDKPWPVQVRRDGTLYIPYFTEDAVKSLDGRTFFCSIDNVPSYFYTTAFKFIKGGTPENDLEITYPTTLKTAKLLNSETTMNRYSVNYKVGPGFVKIQWKKKDKDENTIYLTDGLNSELHVTVRKNTITFNGPFSEKTAGSYICEITWTPADTTRVKQMKSYTYKVELQYYPTVSRSMVPVKYVVDSMDGVVDCKFNEMSVTASLGINGEVVDVTSKSKFDQRLQAISLKFKKYMIPLKSELSPYNPKPGVSIKYTAKEMEFENPIQKLPSTQTVNCIGKNSIGSVRYDTLLKVVPMPLVKPDNRPSSTNCTQCSAKQDHVFKCVISNLEKYNTTDYRVILQQTWMIGNAELSTIAKPGSDAEKYLIASDDLSTLTVKKIDDEKVKNYVNKQAEIQCVIRLSYPAGMKIPEDATGSVFFDSRYFPKMKAELSTPIKLEDIAPVPKAASLSWAIALGLSILVVLIVIILIIFWCRKRPPGETYDVDHTEKKQGNDPETENHEKEAFPVYERPEDGPIRGSRASLDDSIQVGSDDEDEDLAEYDVDIGKFNEEGSFIGQYTNNEGGGGGHQNNSRRLPHVPANTDV